MRDVAGNVTVQIFDGMEVVVHIWLWVCFGWLLFYLVFIFLTANAASNLILRQI